jgi:protein-S-isoprenylcysteine O-methyltransferase Ste14
MPVKPANNATTQTVSLRHWVRLILVYVFILLILLVCGGDLGWWQAWVYSLFIFTSGIGGRIWGEQRHPGLTAERQDTESFQQAKSWDKVLAPLMAVSISFPLVIVAGLDHRYQWTHEFPLWLNLAGLLFVWVGYAFAAWAFAENRFFYSVVRIRTDQGHVVCDSGPYRFVRHPGYAGNMLALFGMALALSSIWTLIPVAVAVIITVVRTVLEDKALKAELPGYQDYARRVRYRLIPAIF